MKKMTVYIFTIMLMLFASAYTSSAGWHHYLTVNNGSGDGYYRKNDTAHISASPAPAGKVFYRWNGTKVNRLGDRYSPNTVYSMPNWNATLTATYISLPRLNVVHGSGDGLYSENDTILIVADPPPPDKLFNQWVGSDAGRLTDRHAESTMFSMPPSSTTLTASYIDDPSASPNDGMQKVFSIVAVGVYAGKAQTVEIGNIRNMTWAQFALWSNNNRGIYFTSGEDFYGAIHANTPLYFSGSPEFFGNVTSAATGYGGSTNGCIFHKGFEFPVAPDSIAEIDFDDLKNKAAVVLEGQTTITLSGKNMIVSNSRAGLNNTTQPIPHNGVIYIKNSTTGSSSTRSGDVSIKGEMDDRVTIVTDRDINIVSHLTYTDDPTTNPVSRNALGLISRRDVVVKQSCPDNLKIFAHIIASGASTTSHADGSFGVESYNSGSPRGHIYLYGGIAQDYRGAVGTFNSSGPASGYAKHYVYDTRFANNPPPEYPPLSNKLTNGIWRNR